METALQISARNTTLSPALETHIRARVTKLEEFFDRIIGARVVVETPHRRHRQGTLFHVRVDLRVPGREIVVDRDPAAHRAYEDVYVAVHDAFDAATRQLEDYVRERRA
jgi:ribosomal subunit interface protein